MSPCCAFTLSDGDGGFSHARTDGSCAEPGVYEVTIGTEKYDVCEKHVDEAMDASFKALKREVKQ